VNAKLGRSDASQHPSVTAVNPTDSNVFEGRKLLTEAPSEWDVPSLTIYVI
jgi:hypothetical protein